MADAFRGVPRQIADFTLAGINQAVAAVRGDSALAQLAAQQLRQHPIALIEHVFRLSPAQRASLARLSDADVGSLISPHLIDALERGTLTTVRIRQPRPRNFVEEAVSGSPAPLVGRTRLVDVGTEDELILPDPAQATASRRVPCEVIVST